MKNRITKVLALVLIAAGLIATSGCDVNVPEKNYTVSFYMNGHGNQIESQTVKEGENAVRPADPTAEGQVFGGWFTDSECSGTEFDFGTAIKSDIQLFAKWIEIPATTYTVTFDANGGSGSMDAQVFTEGVAGKLNSCTFTAPEDKFFAGWAETADGEVKYADGASYTASANVTLYAKWINNYLCFTAGTGGATVSMAKQGSGWTLPNVQYSTDGITWSDFTIGTIRVTLNAGDKVYFKGNNPNGFNTSSSNYLRFVLTGSAAASGNVMSLVDPDCKTTTIPNNWCFTRLFEDCKSLTTAPALKATTLAQGCYSYMFFGCTTLTAAPELPATTLAASCYSGMFSGCTSLTAAPELKSTTLAVSCYGQMFFGCTSLTTAPELPATTLAQGCYACMFSGCTTLTTAPALPATTLADSCYYEMFWDCESLRAAPELKATTLAGSCYEQMFSLCWSLTTAPALPATTLAVSCYEQMFSHCWSLTTAPALPATTLAKRCYESMFSDCKSLTTAPELKATTLAGYCYSNMFYDCTSLTTAPALKATTLAETCYYGMFCGCTSLKAAPELPATTLADYCYYEMFYGCKSLTTAPALPATTLAQECYYCMFSGCTKLSSLNVSFTAWHGDATVGWLSNVGTDVTGTKTFTCPASLDISTRDASHIPSGWTIIAK